MAQDRIRFGDFELDPANFTLRRGTTRIKIERIPCGIAHQWYANLLSIVERHDEALDHARQARALDLMSVGKVCGVYVFSRPAL
jgi:hypothetical protein